MANQGAFHPKLELGREAEHSRRWGCAGCDLNCDKGEVVPAQEQEVGRSLEKGVSLLPWELQEHSPCVPQAIISAMSLGLCLWSSPRTTVGCWG